MRIALIGGGPSALFVYKRLCESGQPDLKVDIYELSDRLGVGMPYGPSGAGPEHVTNVSSSELPPLPWSLQGWLESQPAQTLQKYGVQPQRLHEDRVVPRLLFGDYLEAQFEELIRQGSVQTQVHRLARVSDLRDRPESEEVEVTSSLGSIAYDRVVICTGHNWPRPHEGQVEGYFDSPYPPQKLRSVRNHPVALRGSSLTAIDAIRTLALANGEFLPTDNGELAYRVDPDCSEFRIVMHSRNGLLPCVRIHLDDPQVTDDDLLQRPDWLKVREANDGFVPLDLFFEEDFKKQLAGKDPSLYETIRSLNLEQFVEAALKPREERDPFETFQAEYQQSLESLESGTAVHWKEALSVLSFALNYPAKHFSAEDSLRLSKTLSPLIAIVIAFVPHSSAQQMLALHRAGRLSLVEAGEDSSVEVRDGGIFYQTSKETVWYRTFVDCVGQPALQVDGLPFPTLRDQGVVRPARLRFRTAQAALQQQKEQPDRVQRDPDGSYHLLVPGIAINDSYQPLDDHNKPNPRLAIMAVPYIGGHNPDYSGLDFCEKASELIVEGLLKGPAPAPYSGSSA